MNKKIADLIFAREHAPERFKWWHIGDLFWNTKNNKAVIVLYALRFGHIIGVRHKDAKECDLYGDPLYDQLPFIEGTLAVTVREYIDDSYTKSTFSQKCGRITTNSKPDGMVTYNVNLECFPVVMSETKDRKGMFFRVEQDENQIS